MTRTPPFVPSSLPSVPSSLAVPRIDAADPASDANARPGLCAGKRAVASFLVDVHDFQEIILRDGDDGDAAAPSDVIIFRSVVEVMDYVTPRWCDRFVLTDIRESHVLEELTTRPFFTLISVDAPVYTRWARYQKRREARGEPPQPLEEFLAASDKHMYDPVHGIARVVDRASIKLINPDCSLAALHRKLFLLNLVNPERLRPGWDAYFMQLASLAAKRSNCMKRRVGCVLVREKRVMATGYNGTPKGLTNCNEGGCGRCNSGSAGGTGLATCLCLHAEENALLEAGRERVGSNSILYCDTYVIIEK